MRIAIFLIAFSIIITSCSPLAKFSVVEGERKAPSTIKFTNDSQKADRYEWDFGDGQSSQEENPEHIFFLSGKYDVTLKAYKKNKFKEIKQEIIIDAPDKCLVVIETRFGNMVLELFDETPIHRDNFLKHAENNFYNGLLFHRVIEGFMIQGGDPDSRGAKAGKRLGSGGPGYQIPAEIKNDLVHLRGALAAARAPDSVNPERKSSGSQFYIVHGNKIPENQLDKIEIDNGLKYTAEQREIFKTIGGYPYLDLNYTVFGQVLDGMDVIEKIATVKKDAANRPVEDIDMKVTVIK